MDINLNQIMMSHFVWGLVLGLAIWLITLIKFYFKHRSLRKSKEKEINNLRAEMNKYKKHLQTQLDIESESKETNKKQMEKLKEEKENLKSTIQLLRQKPRREEMLMLQTYDRALEIMRERAPGFAPIWEKTFKEAKEETDKIHKGIVPFVKRVIHPSSTPLSSGSERDTSKMLNTEELFTRNNKEE